MEIQGVRRKHNRGYRPYEIADYGISEKEIFFFQSVLEKQGLLKVESISKYWDDGRLENVPVLNITYNGLVEYFKQKSFTEEGLDTKDYEFLRRNKAVILEIYDKIDKKSIVGFFTYISGWLNGSSVLSPKISNSQKTNIIEHLERLDLPTAGLTNSQIAESYDKRDNLVRTIRGSMIGVKDFAKTLTIFIGGILTALATLAAISDSPSVARLIKAVLQFLIKVGVIT